VYSGMPNRLRSCAAACLLLLFASCTTASEKDLPALDASRMRAAKALVIETDFAQTSYSPGDVVRGSRDGAMRGMGKYLEGASSHEGALFVGLLLAPIGLPVSAATGAGMAHTKEEVDAAVAAFERLSRDTKLLASVAERLHAVLNGDGTGRWACIAAITAPATSPCAGHSPVARLYLRPAFVLRAKGDFDPDIHLSGSIVAVAKVALTPSGDEADTVLEVKWEYSEDLGSFFVLGKDDGALLLRRLETVLDRFAEKIAKDLYLAPRKEKIAHREPHLGPSFTEIPKGVVVRVEQGNDIYSRFTHGTVAPRYGFFDRNCWIAAVDGRATGHHHDTWPVRRTVAVRNGLAKIEMRCGSHLAETDAGSETLHIYIPVEADQRYWTDCRSFGRVKQ